MIDKPNWNSETIVDSYKLFFFKFPIGSQIIKVIYFYTSLLVEKSLITLNVIMIKLLLCGA